MATPTSYGYNGDGLRTSEAAASGVAQFTWDSTPSVPEIISDANMYYIYGPGGLPIEQIDHSGNTAYFFHDANGSTRALLAANGPAGATFTYNAYGNLTNTAGTRRTPLLYAQGYTDQTTGLIYLTHRYYDPRTGQFMSVDPALEATETPYSYAGDDPTNEADPTGLFDLSISGCLFNRCGSYSSRYGLGGGGGGDGFFLQFGHLTLGGGETVIQYPQTGATVASGGEGWGGSVTVIDGHIVSTQICIGMEFVGICGPLDWGGSNSTYQAPNPLPWLENAHNRYVKQFLTTSAVIDTRCNPGRILA